MQNMSPKKADDEVKRQVSASIIARTDERLLANENVQEGP